MRPSGANSIRTRFLDVALPLGVVFAILAALEVAARAGALPMTIPAPSDVAETFFAEWPDLLFHAVPTVVVSVSGYLIAVVVALVAGSAALLVRTLERPIVTAAVFVESIPLIASAPILIVWFGSGTETKTIIATLAALFPLLVGTIQGFRAADKTSRELFHVLSASPAQRLTKLLLPSALPYLFAAFKIAAPLAVLGTLFGEWAGGQDRGLGLMMVYAMFSFDAPTVWMVILTVCGLAVGFYALAALLERVVIRWETPQKVGAS
ncbi:MAG: ABC transporter permease [Pseudomonadota bacterium]